MSVSFLQLPVNARDISEFVGHLHQFIAPMDRQNLPFPGETEIHFIQAICGGHCTVNVSCLFSAMAIITKGMQMKDVAGKVAFVTGGASGIGLAMVKSFTAAGMKVAIADMQEDALAAVAEMFAESNADVITIKVDVTDREAMEDAATQTEASFEKIHVLCNNAGVAVYNNIVDTTYQDWDWVMGVNLQGVINGVQVFTNRIRQHGEGGHIVNTASLAGISGTPNMSVYNTTKFAVCGMSEAIQQDLQHFNIGVSALCPGFVNTGIYTSERNRPGDLQTSEDATFRPSQSEYLDDDQKEIIQGALDAMVDPALIGDMVLHAIQENVFYIFTHPEFKEGFAEKTDSMQRTAEYWQQFIENHQE